MTTPYRDKWRNAERQTYLKRVLSQPTRQSDIRVKYDKSSPTKLREVRDDKCGRR